MSRPRPPTFAPPRQRPARETHQPVNLDDANAALNLARGERERYRAALLKYGRHLDGCAYLRREVDGDYGACGCGLHEAIAAGPTG